MATGIIMTYGEIEDTGLSTLAKEQFESAYRIFNNRVQSEQLMCSLYEAFDEPDKPSHNCLGCNFNEITDQISRFLLTCVSNPDEFLPQQSFAIYAMLLNVVWERIHDIFEIISLPESYRVRHFSVLIMVRRWANFIKHPKAFAWMVHHPEYTFEGTESILFGPGLAVIVECTKMAPGSAGISVGNDLGRGCGKVLFAVTR